MAAPVSLMPISLEPINPTFSNQCPLVATDVSVQVTGLVALYNVTQRFINTSQEPLEVVVKLPLPDGAVVHRLVVRQGARLLEAKVKEIRHAKTLYENAKSHGQQAILAEEARPNLMQLKVTGILPQTPVDVEAEIASPLLLEGGEVRLSFPTTMTPRYVHASTSPEDARKISPPFAKRQDRLYGISFLVELDALAPLGTISSPSHSLVVSQHSPTRATLSLREGEVLPDRDIVIVYQVMASLKTPMLSSFRSKEGETASFMLTLPPPANASEEELLPRHVSFLLDRSGSMQGPPMEAAKRALRGLLRSLGPRDQFSIIAFNTHFVEYPTSVVSDFSLLSADRFLTGISANGGTEILPALQCALKSAMPKGYSRVVVLLTDGSVSNEAMLFSAVKQAVGRQGLRAHAFGIGPSVNRHLVKGFAKSGRGLCDFANEMSSLEPMLAKFQASAGAPIATDISLDVEGSLVSLTPQNPADLDLGRPLTIFGRCIEGSEATIIVRARCSGRSMEERYPLHIPAKAHGNQAIQALWARSYIDELCEESESSNREEILRVSLASQVLSPVTAWVAVDHSFATGQEPETIEVPLHMPAGLQTPNSLPVPSCITGAYAPPGFYAGGSSLSFDAGSVPIPRMVTPDRLVVSAPLIDIRSMTSSLAYAPMEARYRGAALPKRSRGSLFLKILGFPFIAIAAIFVGLFGLISKLFEKKQKSAEAPAPAPMITALPAPSVTAPRAIVQAQETKSSTPTKENTTAEKERAEAALRFLARTQLSSGAFVDAETTKRVLDAFAALGETPERGLYRRQLGRAREFWQKAGAPLPSQLSAPSLEILLASQARGGENDGAIVGHGDIIQVTAAFVPMAASK